MGHIRTITGLASIDTRKKTFTPTFSLIEEKKEHIEYMRECIALFPPSSILLATDDDREGEAIAEHICRVFDLDVITTPRIIFHEITKTALQDALLHPTHINMEIVHQQHARQIVDMLVGFKISPLLWKSIGGGGGGGGSSAGRCQTPALK